MLCHFLCIDLCHSLYSPTNRSNDNPHPHQTTTGCIVGTHDHNISAHSHSFTDDRSACAHAYSLTNVCPTCAYEHSPTNDSI